MTIKAFKKMLDWLYANTDANNQTDVARKAGINQVTMSRILNGKVKCVKPETVRAINAAYGKVFNPEWMRGESDVMLIADMVTGSPASDASPSAVSSPTPSDNVNATLLAAKEETIAALRAQLEEKDRRIADKEELITAKNERIDSMQEQLAVLRAQMTIERGGLEGEHSSRSELVEHHSRCQENV